MFPISPRPNPKQRDENILSESYDSAAAADLRRCSARCNICVRLRSSTGFVRTLRVNASTFCERYTRKENSLIDTSFKILLQRDTMVRTQELIREKETDLLISNQGITCERGKVRQQLYTITKEPDLPVTPTTKSRLPTSRKCDTVFNPDITGI